MLISQSQMKDLGARLRPIFIMSIVEYFSNKNIFGKLIVKEIINTEESYVKTIATSLGISLYNTNADGKKKHFKSHANVVDEINGKTKDSDIGKIIISEDIACLKGFAKVITEKAEPFFKEKNINAFNGTSDNISLKDIRNQDTHYLSHLEIPLSDIYESWRMLLEVITTATPTFFDYMKERVETMDIYFYHDFYSKAVLYNSHDAINLAPLKKSLTEIYAEKVIDKKTKFVSVLIDNNAYAILEKIAKGEYASNSE